MRASVLLAAALAAAHAATLAAAQGTTCVACVLLLGLADQLESGGTPPPTDENPETICKTLGLCDGTCTLFNGTWPVPSPDFPTDGGVIDFRRRMEEGDDTQAPSPAQQTAAAYEAALAATPLTRDSAIAFLRGLQQEEARASAPLGFYNAVSAATRYIAASYAAAVSTGGLAASAADARALASAGATLTSACPGGALNFSCWYAAFDNHVPLMDADGDLFASPTEDLLSNGVRGASWRGRDCNDSSTGIYPGRRINSYGAGVDHNCNGIFGGNGSIPDYEAAFCSGRNAPMGVAILGDSAAAHFHLPPQYLNARSFNLSGILQLALNEADWPQCSWATGWMDTDACPASYAAPMASIYQRFRQRNLCMHRDYQNVGVNGARTGAMAPPGIVNALARNQATDAPVLVFYALIGNDVCNSQSDVASMTTVAEFQANVLAALSYLDTVLPAGSHVAFIPLANGSVLYDITHLQTHPLGVTYPEVYDFLACSGCSPCAGWLNSNATTRELTTQHAFNLSAVYDTIVAQYANFTNFDMYKVNLDWTDMIASYVANGGDAFNIVEPGDGFHESQTGSSLLAEVIFNDLLTNKPDWLPPINQFNDQIAAIFGDQGGY